MLRRLPTLPIAAAIALTLSISGCGGSGDDSDDIKTVSGAGYELTVPKGWSRGNSASGVDVQLVNGSGKERTGSVAVARTTELPEGATLNVLAAALRNRLLTSIPELSPSDVSRPRPTSLAGTDAFSVTIDATVEGNRAHVRALVTVHDGVEYTVTFAGPPGNAGGQLTDYRSMLESWKWRQAGDES